MNLNVVFEIRALGFDMTLSLEGIRLLFGQGALMLQLAVKSHSESVAFLVRSGHLAAQLNLAVMGESDVLIACFAE